MLGALIALAAIGGFESLGEQVGVQADDVAQRLGGASSFDDTGSTGSAADSDVPGASAPESESGGGGEDGSPSSPNTLFPGLDAPQAQSVETGNDNPPPLTGWNGD